METQLESSAKSDAWTFPTITVRKQHTVVHAFGC